MTQETKPQKSERIVIEASWAPQDPRDKLYDADATAQEKARSLYRILASFHPVLNLLVLATDSFRKFGWLRAFGLWGVFVGALFGLYWWLTA